MVIILYVLSKLFDDYVFLSFKGNWLFYKKKIKKFIFFINIDLKFNYKVFLIKFFD